MYYLRLKQKHSLFERADGSVMDCGASDRAIFKSNRFGRFYRQDYGIPHSGMHLYRCKKLKTILELRKDTFDYCGEWFDVWDENGMVELRDGKDHETRAEEI